MKTYRINQEVYKDKSVIYYPQHYTGFFTGWKSLGFNGQKFFYSDDIAVSSREEALKAIDLCEKGRNVLIQVTYEYL